MSSRQILGAVLLAISARGIAATWETQTDVDAMTDQRRTSAFVRNDAGNTFSVYRLNPNNGPVWANFSISNQILDQIDHKKLILYRIDKNTPVEVAGSTEVEKLLGQKMVEWEPKWVNFQVWHGKSEQPNGSILALMTGTELIVRYYLPTGGYKDTRFTLEGANEAISAAIGLESSQSPEDVEKRSAEAEARTEALIKFTYATSDALKTCVTLRTADRAACNKKFDACNERHKKANDVEGFHACMNSR